MNTKTIVRAPRKYGNPYFDVMEAPLSCWPETTVVRLKFPSLPEELVEIPTAEVFAPGDFVARHYACTPYSRIQRWLTAYGKTGYSSLCVENAPDIRADASYETK